uniref:Putative secreted protein n=1 Tax=Amblyomma triste TaxID=251400 RepID=A0A023GAY1_AMBTT
MNSYKVVSFALYALVSAAFTSGVLYEDNALNAERQRAKEFTDIDELLWVTRQSRSMVYMPRTACQAMMKARQVQPGTFEYIVYYSTVSERRNMRAFVTQLTTSTSPTQSGPRLHPNVLSFRASERTPAIPFKVMYADAINGCFILVISFRGNIRACRVLQRSSTVNRGFPPACRRVYAQNCPTESKYMYNSACRIRISHIVHYDRSAD